MDSPKDDKSANEQKANAGLEYFSFLYGSKDESGQPQQTKIDKLRDRLLLNLYRKHGQVSIDKSRVVDVGCGYGWLLESFHGAAELAGVDIAHHAIEIAKNRNPKFDFKQGNLEDGIPFSGTFDLILAINVIEHLANPEAGIRSIAYASHPGAIVLVHLPTISNRLTRWEYAKLYAADPTHIFRPTGKQVRRMFEAAGFITVRESFLPHFPAWLTRLYPIHPAYLAVFRKR